jgi:hypothetical protein
MSSQTSAGSSKQHMEIKKRKAYIQFCVFLERLAVCGK